MTSSLPDIPVRAIYASVLVNRVGCSTVSFVVASGSYSLIVVVPFLFIILMVFMPILLSLSLDLSIVLEHFVGFASGFPFSLRSF